MPDRSSVQFVLLDIEGTTTPIDFVFRTLFPYARRRFEQFLRASWNEPGVREDLSALRAQYRADHSNNVNPPEWDESSFEHDLSSATLYAHWLMDRNSKCPALKSLQGKIWEQGYRAGELRGEVYPDVPLAMFRWKSQGKHMGIFSSGSVLAQKLLFSSTEAGDLTRFLDSYFDTNIGAKGDAQSYSRIADSLALAPPQIVFLSDVVAELDAARQAGMQTALSVRGEEPHQQETPHPVIRSFDEVFP